MDGGPGSRRRRRCACQAAGVAAYTVQNSAECLADPQLAAPGPLRPTSTTPTAAASWRPPGSGSAAPRAAPAGRAPQLGEHTFEVLTDLLGYDADRVADLAAAELLE